jgi:LPS sulfotransferase NodH
MFPLDLLGPKYDLPETPIRLRYCVLSSPRSGSTMLCSALHASGLAGVPYEYFNPVYTRHGGEARLRSTFQIYIGGIERRRTTANGVFGTNLQFEQFGPAKEIPEAARIGLDFVTTQNRLILTSRRDKIAQAISYVRARKTRDWQRLPGAVSAGVPDPIWTDVEMVKIARALHFVMVQDQQWRHLLAREGLAYLEVVYEDMLADYRGQMRRVFDYLGLAPETIPPPATAKLVSGNDAVKEIFLEVIGAGAPGRQ